MEESRWLSALAGGPVSLKCENLQRTGSFKIRGAYVRIVPARPPRSARTASSRPPPATTRRASRSPRSCSASRRPSSCPRGRRSRRRRRPAAYGADVVFHGRYLEERWSRRRRFAERHRGGADPPLRPRRHRRRAGHRSASRSSSRRPTCRPCSCRPAAAACSPAIAIAVKALRPDVPGRRGAGGRRRGVPRARSSRATRSPLASMTTMADGIAVGRPATSRSPRSATTSTRSSRSPRSPCRAPLLALLERAKLVVEPAGAAAVAALLDAPDGLRDPGGRGALRRQHRPAAARQGDPARHGRRRPLPQPARPHPRHPRRPGPAAHRDRRGRRQRARGRARADLAARCTSTRSRCSSSSRPAATQHAEQVLGPAPRARLPGRRVGASLPAGVTPPVQKLGASAVSGQPCRTSAGERHRVDDDDLERPCRWAPRR